MTIFSTAGKSSSREPLLEIGGKVLFYPDFALRTAGGDVSVDAPWKSYVLQEDRELISGQNPFSDEALPETSSAGTRWEEEVGFSGIRIRERCRRCASSSRFCKSLA